MPVIDELGFYSSSRMILDKYRLTLILGPCPDIENQRSKEIRSILYTLDERTVKVAEEPSGR